MRRLANVLLAASALFLALAIAGVFVCIWAPQTAWWRDPLGYSSGLLSFVALLTGFSGSVLQAGTD